MQIYQLSDKIQELDKKLNDVMAEDLLDNLDKEELIENILEDYDQAEGNLKDKLLSLADYVNELRAELESRKAYLNKIKRMNEVVDNKINRLKDYLGHYCDKHQIFNAKGIQSQVFVRKKPKQLVVHCPADELPVYYQNVKTTADKNLIKRDLQNGIELEFAELVDPEGYSIIIK